MADTLLYQIGKFVGGAIKDLSGMKSLRKIIVDQANGTEDNDGLNGATSNFLKGLMTASQFLTTQLVLQNSDTPFLFSMSFGIQNQIYMLLDSSANSQDFGIIFKPIANDSSIIGKLIVSNSHIIFESFYFKIDESVTPDVQKDLLATPFFFQNSNIVFRNCKFEYTGDSENICWIAGVNSTIQVYNCTLNGDFLFIYGSNPNVPNLFIKDNLTISGNITLQDTDSVWINYGNP